MAREASQEQYPPFKGSPSRRNILMLDETQNPSTNDAESLTATAPSNATAHPDRIISRVDVIVPVSILGVTRKNAVKTTWTCARETSNKEDDGQKNGTRKNASRVSG